MDINKYPSNLKIFYKLYKDLWREVKIGTKMRFTVVDKSEFLSSICFFIEYCTIFFHRVIEH